MRVLVIGANYAPEPSGNAPYTSALARRLAERGHDVRVITTHPHYPEWRVRASYGAWSSREVVDGVPVRRLRHYVPRVPTPGRRLAAETSFGLRSAAVRWPASDVVLLVSPSLFAAASALARARLSRVVGRERRVVLWTQDLYSLGVEETGTATGAVARVVQAVERAVTRGSDAVVAIHDRFAAHLVRVLGVPPERVTTVRNWTHLPERAPVDRAAARRALGWRDDEVVVLHAGNQGAKQGLENVVEAGRLVDRRGLRVRFVLLGDGSRRRELEAAADGVRSVQFVDPLPDEGFVAAMAAADVLLVNELAGLSQMSVPSKLTSYFDAGRPVLAATAAGSTTAEELAAAGAGLRVEPEDPGALVDAVVRLADDPAGADRLGAAGRRYRRSVLSEDAAVARFERWLSRWRAGGPGYEPPRPERDDEERVLTGPGGLVESKGETA